MPPRPFPFPITVGTDICSVARIFKILNASADGAKRGDRFAKRILVPAELQSRWSPHLSTLQQWDSLQKKRIHLGLESKAFPQENYYARVPAQSAGFSDDDLLAHSTHHSRRRRKRKAARHGDAVERETAEQLLKTLSWKAPGTRSADARNLKTPTLSTEISQGREETVEGINAKLVNEGDPSLPEELAKDEDAGGAQADIGPGGIAGETRDSSKDETVGASEPVSPVLEQLDNLFPKVWNIAQFLAGR